MSDERKTQPVALPPSPTSTPSTRRGERQQQQRQNDNVADAGSGSSSFDSLPISASLVFLSSISREVENDIASKVQREQQRRSGGQAVNDVSVLCCQIILPLTVSSIHF